jgi:hypothetical protein
LLQTHTHTHTHTQTAHTHTHTLVKNCDYAWYVVDRFTYAETKIYSGSNDVSIRVSYHKSKKVKMVKIKERRIKPAVQQEKIFVAHTTILFPMK